MSHVKSSVHEFQERHRKQKFQPHNTFTLGHAVGSVCAVIQMRPLGPSMSLASTVLASLRTINKGFFRTAHISTTSIMSEKIRHASTKAHYESHSADSYDSAFFYEVGPYTEHLRNLCRSRLQLDKTADETFAAATSHHQQRRPRVLLDIGGGTGTFTRMLIQDTPCQAIVIDPFLEKQNKVDSKPSDDPVTFVAAPAEAFMNDPTTPEENSWRRGYDQILIKEVAHHFAEQDRTPIFRGMWDGLVPSSSSAPAGPPSLLMITRPQIDIDYPLWEEARAVWAKNQPSLDQFVSELKAAGFSNIQHSVEAYPCAISLERWQSMVKARFWSTFANFSDDELNEACAVIAENERHRITADGTLHFEDRLLFISASRV
jgi:hypothetical protein